MAASRLCGRWCLRLPVSVFVGALGQRDSTMLSEEVQKKIDALVETENGKVVNCPNSNELYQAEQALLIEAVKTHPDIERIILFDVQKVVDQFLRWKRNLPRNNIRFAVKCNPNKMLLKVLCTLGAGFDCASPQEMRDAMEVGCPVDKIIYSNPCKQNYALKFMKTSGVKLTVFDNDDEVDKIAKFVPGAHVLVRIRCDDVGSRCPMSCKFGSGPEDWKRLLLKVKDAGLKMRGVHFHVGSGCGVSNAFEKPIMQARQIFDLAEELGMEKLDIVNTGGGYPGLFDPRDEPLEDVTFEDMAKCIRVSLDKYFPESEFPHLTCLSEPGRYFAAGTQTFGTTITARYVPSELRKVFGLPETETQESSKSNVIYTIADSVYGYFNVILFDHARIVPYVLISKDPSAKEKPRLTTDIYGLSCEKCDVVATNVQLPPLEVGDWLFFKNQGAYTSAAISSFGNGVFEEAVTIYTRIVRN